MSETSGRFRKVTVQQRSLPATAFFIFHYSFGLSSAAEPASGTLFYHTAYPEASAVAVVGSPPRWLAVVDNEVPRVALFPLEPQATKIHAPALSVATSPAYAVNDLEAVTVFPWDANGDGKPESLHHVFAGSCSRTKKGKAVPERDALFAVIINSEAVAAEKPGAFPAADAVEYNRTMRSQIRALGSEHADTPWGPVLRDSAWAQGQQPDAQNIVLAGGSAAGLNIEGLTVSKDARALLLGLRSPVVQGLALLIPVTNPVAALGLGEGAPQPLALAAPLLLDLGGLGFRSIEWDGTKRRYLIVAGSAEDREAFRLYTWSGEADEKPVAVTSAAATAAAKIEPEGVTPVPGCQSAVLVGDGSAGAPFHKGQWVDFSAAP